MKKGYSVENGYIYKSFKFILVDNYISSNRVCNYYGYNLNNFALDNAVGVWKIKNKN